ncbi:uncharacterized protein LOC106645033 [Copidosoma floridanum]|uniref:uncharacterized protein LOC106645033 n=1 Tax=Copidosoma floridanum TaxID=29053 RepID=UPI0006C94EB2|nr:uncharacterized protein LOC106645033 [Copidosoma floridanum]
MSLHDRMSPVYSDSTVMFISLGYKGTPRKVTEKFAAVDGSNKLDGFSRRKKRAVEEIRGPYNANWQSRYVELALVIDKNEYVALGENLTRVYHHCKDIANIINALYAPLNIFIALVGVEVWREVDEIHLGSNGDATLSNFLQYRREKLVKNIPNDNAQLLTRMKFDDGVVGKALKGPICTNKFSGGVSVDHSNIVALVAATVAHEMGHNFGMEHDTLDCKCQEERCIMSPSSGSSGPKHWSSCSVEYLAVAFEHGMDYCLRNKPKRLFGSPICGNGFVEPGEQCDCGLSEKCDNPCCDASSCMLHANASCATGECCDLTTCKPKRAGTECRVADQECDLPEYCTGQSEYCPADVFKMAGEPCKHGQAYCYQGNCRTHSDQCKLLWGPTGSSSDDMCYKMNSKGTAHGNCGFNQSANDYVRCQEQNVFCGMLHCKHLNEKLEFGMDSIATLSHSFLNSEGKIIACRSAIVDLGLNQIDPGLAPDGAKCGHGKMCVNQKCMPVSELQRVTSQSDRACSSDCNGNGVCNSLGHCHCNQGYLPPDCTEAGVGGSVDSGPAGDPNARSEYIMFLYITFLGIVPVCSLIWVAIWLARHKSKGMKHWTKTGPGNPISTLTRNFGYHHHSSTNHHPRTGNGSLPIKTIERGQRPLGIDSIDSSIAAQDPLLPKCDTDERFNNNFFGQFKGFSITPLSRSVPAADPAQLAAPLQAPITRPAPPPPSWNEPSIVPIKTNCMPASQRVNSLPQRPAPEEPQPASENPPMLPPPNAGSTARPLISSPVLAATTCTNLDLKLPTRPAPEVPCKFQAERPVSASPETPVENDRRRGSAEKMPAGSNSTLTRIASMLYPGGKSDTTTGPSRYSANSLPRSHHLKASKVMDKEILRSLKISAPIPQREIEIPVPAIPVKPEPNGDTEATLPSRKVARTQSMRDTSKEQRSRPTIHSFGSMRHPNGKRPTSIPARVRPTSPPPGPPPAKLDVSPTEIPGVPGYQNPAALKLAGKPKETYEDCMNLTSSGETANLGKIVEESPSNDNIYAVIEEAVPEKKLKRPTAVTTDNEYKTPRVVRPVFVANTGADEVDNRTSSGSDSMGLLSEIVSEISNRNFDSIYSTDKLSPKHQKPEEAFSLSSSNTDVSTPHYKSPSSVCSTTSLGYVHPSAINVHDKRPETIAKTPATHESAPVVVKPAIVDKVSDKKKDDSQQTTTATTPPTKPTFSRTKTPPSISRQKSPRQNSNELVMTSGGSRPTSRQNSDSSLKSSKSDASKDGKTSSNSSNSPDIVSSCNQTAQKTPDVLSSKPRTTTTPRQKSVKMPPKPSNLLTKAASFAEQRIDTAKTTTKETKTAAGLPQKVPAGKSNVASLQQKFEQSEVIGTGSGTLTKKKPQTTTNSGAKK